MLEQLDKVIIIAACLSAILFVAVVMACKLAPFCILYKYCPFRAHYGNGFSDDEDEKEKHKKAFKQKQMVFYGRQQLPVPGTKATYLDAHSEPESVASSGGYSKSSSSRKGLVLDGGYGSSSHGGIGSGADSSGVNYFQSTYEFPRTKRQHQNTSTSGSADENANVNRYVDYLNGSYDPTGRSRPGSTRSAQTPSPTAPLTPTHATASTEHQQLLQISFAVQYDQQTEKFTVYLSNVNNLESNVYGASVDSFVRILLIKDLKQRWRKSADISFDQLTNPDKFGYELTHEFQTKLVRRNLNPIFNEFFTCQLKEKDKRCSTLKFVACTVDKFSQPKVVGHCQINIGKNSALLNELKQYTIPLKEYTPELGEILLTLTYLPTSQRLNVNIIKATNLKLPNSYKAINPFVKILLVQKGKTMEKHTTQVQSQTRNPVFNEQFFFDLPSSEVNKVVLLCSVYHRDQSPTTATATTATATSDQSVTTGVMTSSSTADQIFPSIGTTSPHQISPTAANQISPTYDNDDRAAVALAPPISMTSSNAATGVGGGMSRSVLAVSDYYLCPERSNGWSSASSDEHRFKTKRSYSACLDRISKAEFAASIPKCKSAQRLNSRYVCLGRVALGSHAKASARSHWTDVINNPRKQIAHSHKLQQ